MKSGKRRIGSEKLSDPEASEPALFGLFVLDVLHDVADGEELLRVAVGYFYAKFFFKSHDELDDVEGVGTQVLDKFGFGCDLLRVDAELFNDDVFDFLVDGFFAHSGIAPVFVRSAVRILGGIKAIRKFRGV
jgi:hypothetical protein